MNKLRTVTLPDIRPKAANAGRAGGLSVVTAIGAHALLVAVFGWVIMHTVVEPSFSPPVSITATYEESETPIPELSPLVSQRDQPEIAPKRDATPPSASAPQLAMAQTAPAKLPEPALDDDDFGKQWPEKKAAPAPTKTPVKKSPPKPSPTTQKRAAPSPPKPKAYVKPTRARVSRSYPPSYPSSARRAGIEGTTQVSLRVGSNGRVQSASIARSSGNASLDGAALNAARKWRFTPATRGGAPVTSTVIIPIRFNLR